MQLIESWNDLFFIDSYAMFKEYGGLELVKEKFFKEFPDASEEDLHRAYHNLDNSVQFKINENIHDFTNNFTEHEHFLMRCVTEFFITLAFNSMLVMPDENVLPNSKEGNIGTPGRVAKMWCGANLNDDSELMSGRWAKPVRIAKFPNSNNNKIPIVKTVDMTAVCSHHLLPFSTKFDENSKLVIAYIPDQFVLGVSKLQRLVRYVSQRGWLQEDLVKKIYDEISKAAETKDVFVGIYNVKHSCEWLRGANTFEGGFTTVFYDGKFKQKENIKFVENAIAGA